MTIVNTSIDDNSSAGYLGGGGLGVFRDASATLTDCMIAGNSANNNGGGLSINNSGTASLTNSTISGNSASNDGGGLSIEQSGTATLTNCAVSGNSAYGGGGLENGGGHGHADQLHRQRELGHRRLPQPRRRRVELRQDDVDQLHLQRELQLRRRRRII